VTIYDIFGENYNFFFVKIDPATGELLNITSIPQQGNNKQKKTNKKKTKIERKKRKKEKNVHLASIDPQSAVDNSEILYASVIQCVVDDANSQILTSVTYPFFVSSDLLLSTKIQEGIFLFLSPLLSIC
jgi:hypothetical protein